MTRPAVLVCGLGRCGSSLTMQMLAAGGVQCVGDFPDFEVEELNHQEVPARWLRQMGGRAMKLLNPHHSPLPSPGEVPTFAIWLTRDRDQQAASQLKFASLMLDLPRADRAHRRRVAAGLPLEEAWALRSLAGRPLLRLSYEGLIIHPRRSADTLASFLREWWPAISPAAMALAVRKTDPNCAPGLDMELALVEESLA